MKLLQGKAHPLGATVRADGVNFAVFSKHATRLWLCLFDDDDQELARLPLHQGEGFIWHGLVQGQLAQPGCRYGFRAEGAAPAPQGDCFDVNKLLLDPYGKAVSAPLQLPALLAHQGDNALVMPKSVVTAPLPPMAIRRPQIPAAQTVIYELHIKGFSQLNPHISEAKRGTIAALAEPWALEHFKRLGVTTIELLPIHYFADEPHLAEKNLSNYWGYNSAAFFAIQPSYCPGGAAQFRQVVASLHRHGIEVLLDVVFNHSGEGDQHGATFSFRGLDNRSYYRLTADGQGYVNHSGCGNSLNLASPVMQRLLCDSLRYWAELGVDGFRFDLATTMGRDPEQFCPSAGLLAAIAQDPQLSQLKLIAEPWDLGNDGYQLGNFPSGWCEWNDFYRDTVRRFWRGDGGLLPDLAKCLHGSAEHFEHNGRGIAASVNFITAHDGFTLADLVSYTERRNLANGEQNRDGHQHNCAFNCGHEGATELPQVLALRCQQQRNLLATLLLSQGTPMLLAGDELANSQQGNNNSYCQDNEIGWLQWPDPHPLTDFIAKLTAIRKRFPQFKQTQFHRGNRFSWLHPEGRTMTAADWNDPQLSGLQLQIDAGNSDDSLRLLLNNGQQPLQFQLASNLSDCGAHRYWRGLVDTATADPTVVVASNHITVQAFSLQLIHRVTAQDLPDESISS